MIGYTPPVKKKTTNVQAEGNFLFFKELDVCCWVFPQWGFVLTTYQSKDPLSQNVHQCLGNRSGINGEDGIWELAGKALFAWTLWCCTLQITSHLRDGYVTYAMVPLIFWCMILCWVCWLGLARQTSKVLILRGNNNGAFPISNVDFGGHWNFIHGRRLRFSRYAISAVPLGALARVKPGRGASGWVGPHLGMLGIWMDMNGIYPKKMACLRIMSSHMATLDMIAIVQWILKYPMFREACRNFKWFPQPDRCISSDFVVKFSLVGCPFLVLIASNGMPVDLDSLQILDTTCIGYIVTWM